MRTRLILQTTAREAEDRADAITHAMGVGGALAGIGLLATLAAATRDPWKIASTSVYGTTLVLLFAASTLYHAARSSTARRVLRLVDHASIPLLIAGTYTPFLLVNLRAGWGWPLFATIWGLAACGVGMTLASSGRFKTLRTLVYLAMGWLVLIAIVPLGRTLGTAGLALLVSGGIVYSAGTVFYALDRRMPFGHAVWHVLVLGASVCHFLSIVVGVIPYGAG